jgi:multicomponent Na+:H+ antiporter subunit D
LDFDWFYRKLGRDLYGFSARLIGEGLERTGTLMRRWVSGLIQFVFRHHGPEGMLAATLSAGNMVLWVVAVLGGVLVLYFF